MQRPLSWNSRRYGRARSDKELPIELSACEGSGLEGFCLCARCFVSLSSVGVRVAGIRVLVSPKSMSAAQKSMRVCGCQTSLSVLS